MLTGVDAAHTVPSAPCRLSTTLTQASTVTVPPDAKVTGVEGPATIVAAIGEDWPDDPNAWFCTVTVALATALAGVGVESLNEHVSVP